MLRLLVFCSFYLFSLNTTVLGEDLTILSWNVENLFDDKDDFDGKGRPVEYIEFRKNFGSWNKVTYYRKLERIAKVLKGLTALPDIMIWEEVENFDVGIFFLKRFLRNHHYSYVVGSLERGTQVVLFSRFPLRSIDTFSFQSKEMSHSRPAIKVKFFWKDHLISVVGVHLKAWKGKNDDYSANYRKRQLEALGNWLNSNLKDQEIVFLVGDLNTIFERYDLLGEDLGIQPEGKLYNSQLPVKILTYGRKDGTFCLKKGLKHTISWLDGALMSHRDSLKVDIEVKIDIIQNKIFSKGGCPLSFRVSQVGGVSDHFPFLLRVNIKQKNRKTD